MASYQALLSLGFSRQEHWSGLPFPSPMHESEKWKWSRSVMSDSYQPHGLQPTRLLRPWDFPGKSTGVGCHCLLQMTSKSWVNSKASASREASASRASGSCRVNSSIPRRKLRPYHRIHCSLLCNNINATFLSNQKLCSSWEKKMHVFGVCVCMKLRTVNFENLSFNDWKPIDYISNFV